MSEPDTRFGAAHIDTLVARLRHTNASVPGFVAGVGALREGLAKLSPCRAPSLRVAYTVRHIVYACPVNILTLV